MSQKSSQTSCNCSTDVPQAMTVQQLRELSRKRAIRQHSITAKQYVKTNRRSNPRHEESSLQIDCVDWFRHTYPQCARLLFAVPNGGRRSAATGRILKSEGVVAGVADLILFVAHRGYHALCIEMKTAKGRQQDTQKAWQQAVEAQGYKYIICRSLDDFKSQVSNYLWGTFIVTT